MRPMTGDSAWGTDTNFLVGLSDASDVWHPLAVSLCSVMKKPQRVLRLC